MNHDEYVSALRENARALTDAARTTDMLAAVPSCPDWAVRDLLLHMGGHHRWVRGNVDRTPEDGMQPYGAYEPAPEGVGAIDWVADGARALADRLTEVGPNQRCWTWVADRTTTGFWARRTANETALHRWDMQNAAGPPASIDAPHAIDGILEHLAMMERGFLGGPPRGDGETIHLHATDIEGEWLVQLNADGMTVTPTHAKGDVAVRAPASDLWLVLAGRLAPSTVEVFGDEDLLTRWRAAAKF